MNSGKDSTQPSVLQPPPNKRRKTKKSKNYWVIKVPNWLADDWFNPRNHPKNAHLCDIRVWENESNTNTNTKESSNSKCIRLQNLATNPKFPTDFEIQARDLRVNSNVKHGELQTTGVSKLALFSDKPPFSVKHRVQALDLSKNQSDLGLVSLNVSESEDDDIQNTNTSKSNKRNSSNNNKSISIKLGNYRKGTIIHVNDERTFDIEFDDGHVRTDCPMREIRFLDPSKDAPKADNCKIWSLTSHEMDIQPIWNAKYQQFLKYRSFRMNRGLKSIVNEVKNEFTLSAEKRESIANAKIARNKKAQMQTMSKGKREKAMNVNKKPRMKRVRKEEEEYKQIILSIFDKNERLSQKEVISRTGEPWSFLQNMMQKFCVTVSGTGKNSRSKEWQLKEEYVLYEVDEATEKIGKIAKSETK